MEADVLIIGAGVVGLACGAELARRGLRVIVIERHAGPGQETSSRNSEIIHAGIYYPANSLKAKACVEGRELLYARCAELRIPHRKTGKYIVATSADEVDELERIRTRGLRNGAGALEIVDRDEITRREPRVRAQAALWSPESGIVDSHALMQSYQAELEAGDGTVVFHTDVQALAPRSGGGWEVGTASDRGESFSIEVGWVVNAAGLAADRIASLAGIDVEAAELTQHPCKGDYFAVAARLGALTQHLVYPVPIRGGLGIHVTVDLGGRYRLGPDVEWIDDVHYDVAPEKATRFAEAVQRYLPQIEAADLSPDFAGIRPKLQRAGDPFRDFYLAEGSSLGAPQLVSLLGIESPGLTAAAALARRVAALVE